MGLIAQLVPNHPLLVLQVIIVQLNLPRPLNVQLVSTAQAKVNTIINARMEPTVLKAQVLQ